VQRLDLVDAVADVIKQVVEACPIERGGGQAQVSS